MLLEVWPVTTPTARASVATIVSLKVPPRPGRTFRRPTWFAFLDEGSVAVRPESGITQMEDFCEHGIEWAKLAHSTWRRPSAGR